MYRLHRSGGRVKSAGLGLDVLYPEEAELYASDPSPERAARLRAAFRAVQSHPPPALRAAFFPLERRAVAQHLERTGLYRPFLKTDQGPPGTFVPFGTGGIGALRRYHVAHREGVAIPEVHAWTRLDNDPAASRLVARVHDAYRQLRLDDCGRAVAELADLIGIAHRTANVGRGLFFFCNPSMTDVPVTVPEDVCVRVEQMVNALLERAQGKAAHVRQLYRDGASLDDALARADYGDATEEVLYLQADVYLALDGTIEIDQIQLPDVGLFLGGIPAEQHNVLPRVQGIVRDLSDRVAEMLGRLPSPTYLVVRPAVVHNHEDTLEHLEIRTIQKLACQAGVDLRVATTWDVAALPVGAQILLLNVDPASVDCEALLQRTARAELACTPDPFLKLLAPELTTARRTLVRGEALARLLQTIRSGQQVDGKSHHAMHRGIERLYRHGGQTSDILHVEVPGEHTLVPTLRHSVHSFTALYNVCKRNGFPELHIREVPITRDNAVLHSDTGPHVCAFRFFFTPR